MPRLFIVDILVLFFWTLRATVYGRTCNTFEHNECHVLHSCLLFELHVIDGLHGQPGFMAVLLLSFLRTEMGNFWEISIP